MKKQDRDFLESQLKDAPDDYAMKAYRASWFRAANFKCPEHHTFRFAWEHCYLPMESLWPTAACQKCQKAKDLLKDAARQREEFLKRRHDFQNRAGSKVLNHHQKERGCRCSSECQHKNAEEKSENTQDTGFSKSSLQISFCDGDNLAKVLSDHLARMLWNKRGLTFCHCLKRIHLAIAILFLQRSFEIVVKVHTNQYSCTKYITKKHQEHKNIGRRR